MSQKLAIKKSNVSVTGPISGSVIIDEGQAYKIHMVDIILASSGDGTMTIRDKHDGHILSKVFTASDRNININGSDIFGGGGRVMMNLSASITITGTIQYWKEDTGHSVVKRSERRNDG